jgi:segregation and condensation protein A
MSVTFRVEKFEGPLDLLLQLIEREELDITEISLAGVAEQYVEYVHANKGKIPPEELADFLVVAAKLVYMKSRLLLPSLEDEELEEGPDLATQLRLYQQFMGAATELNHTWNAKRVCYGRDPRPMRSLEPKFSPPPNVAVEDLRNIMQHLIARLAPIVKLPQAAIKRIVRIQDKIAELANRLRSVAKMTFASFVSKAKDKQERLVSFLALLELVKQRVVTADQSENFEDIEIAAHDLDRLADLKIEFV